MTDTTPASAPVDSGPTLAFLSLRLWLGMRAILTGIEKFSDTKSIQVPLLGSDGQPDPSGAIVEIPQKFYAFANYHAVPDSLRESLSREPLLPGVLLTGFYGALGGLLIATGLLLLLGLWSRISLFAMALMYVALSAGLILIKQDAGVAWLAIHVGLVAYALTLVRHNRWAVTRA